MKNFIFITLTLLGLILLSIFLFQSFRVKKTAPAPATQTEKIVDALPKETPKILPQAPLNEKPSIPAVYPVEIPDSVSFSGEATPLDIFYVREYLDRELIVNTYFHSSTLLLLKRANRWFPVIEPILARYKIPNDFKYLAMIESGFENVVSPAGATGYWQFLSHTAREYGLEVNSGIDERYNVEKSTEAACKYLIDAYEKYGNWTLVAAAYNAGKRRITEEIELQKVNNYYDLLLNQETARYIFRILAIKTIFENPENYGFHIEAGDLYPVIPTENIEVTKTVKSLVDFAREHNITYKILKYFNPWLRKDHLPNRSGRTYLIKIPVEGSINYPALVKSQSRTAD